VVNRAVHQEGRGGRGALQEGGKTVMSRNQPSMQERVLGSSWGEIEGGDCSVSKESCWREKGEQLEGDWVRVVGGGREQEMAERQGSYRGVLGVGGGGGAVVSGGHCSWQQR
jgi:hypothetical protein